MTTASTSSVKKVHPNYSLERLRRLRTCMRELKLDAFITLDPSNIRWLSGWQNVFDEEPAHLALVTARTAYIHTDARYSGVMLAKNKQDMWRIEEKPAQHFTFLLETLAKNSKKELRLGYESSIRLDVYKALKKKVSATGIKLAETKGLFSDLRAVKDAEEIKLLRKAQSITDAAFAELLTWVNPGMQEQEVANRLEFCMREKGSESIAFSSIVASGPHAAMPHARPTTRRLQKGDFLTLDFGARYRDYCADMTRTLVIGEATDKQKQVYEAVLAAQQKAKAGIKAGITGKEADAIAREVLTQKGFEKAFTHSLGHGVGIEVHEQPALSPSNEKVLLSGNVVTVEPGVYLPGYGGVRIEDFGLVEDRGFSCFTKSPHRLIEV